MKKFLSLILTAACILSLAACGNSTDNIIDTKQSVTGIVQEVHDDYVILYAETAEGYPNGSRWHISLNTENADSYTDVVVGDEIIVYYDGPVKETDPLGPGKIYLITLKTPADRTSETYNWGVTFTAKDVTPSGLTIVCNQTGGEGVAELSTGSFYKIQKLEEAGWTDVEYLPQEYDIAWDSLAYNIQKEAETTWEVNWEWLYGQLPVGKYRIGKEVMNFRDTGDYDTEMVYAEFEINTGMFARDRQE